MIYKDRIYLFGNINEVLDQIRNLSKDFSTVKELLLHYSIKDTH